ncbi:MAG: hypothetical protein FJX55_14885 [Alphaproteobacteria bacterium]|nr:hypothetical protein [Alphaproteobacteria bacterium]
MIARYSRLLLVLGLLCASPAFAQTRIHGADSLFASPALKLAWAVLKTPVETDTAVVIRLVNLTNEYRFFRVEALDPFTKDRAVLDAGRSFERIVDLTILRTKFSDHPSAEIALFRTADQLKANQPDLVVYYLGVPDTTPEFAAAPPMSAYLDKMLGITR